MHIGIACGGTGGHIFPGIATAEVLKKRGHDVVLWLTGRDVENTSLEGWKGQVERINAIGFPSGFSLLYPAAFLSIVKAFRLARSRMKTGRPDVLLAMGSYASVGPVLAARSLGVPVILHEANAVPGRAISLLSRFSSAVAVMFEETSQFLRHAKVVVTGLPIRSELLSRTEGRFLEPDTFTVLVTGGSQGAHALNNVVSSTLCRLYKKGMSIQVIHLTGAADENSVRQKYEKAGISHEVFGFLKDMKKAYNSVDLVVARAGAATCAEISVCGVPALLVPLPFARKQHQMVNAVAMMKTGGVDVITEKELNEKQLVSYIKECSRDRKKLREMRDALKSFAVPDAAERLADLVEKEGSGDTAKR
ncbi:undecaprenyldiphospho-muramoylpentapeptide beta-N-acetylglucosaminyltransferase [Verrucomicrobiota bacterium]